MACVSLSLALAALLACASCGGDSSEVQRAEVGPAPSWPIQLGTRSLPAHDYERVVLVTLDTLRADHVGCYGYGRATTPFLDSLAERGVRFTRAFSQISHTAPAHASLLTGLVPSVHGLVANGMELSDDATTLADLFERAGYATAAFVNVRFLQGVTGHFQYQRAAPNTGVRVLERALEWLASEERPDRFFLWLHLYDPHHWNKPDLWPREELDDLARTSPRTDEELYAEIAHLHGFEDPRVATWDRPEHAGEAGRDHASIASMLAAYDAQILHTDRLLQHFHDAIEGLDLPGATLWIVTSDHGEGLGSHGYFGHTARIYNEQLRVPLVVAADDGWVRPAVVDATVEQVDLLPTLAELVGVELTGVDDVIDGRSFLGRLRGRTPGPERAVWSERCSLEGMARLEALQTPDWKLLVEDGATPVAYDLRADALELAPLELEDAPPAAGTLYEEYRMRAARVRARAAEVADGDASPPPAEWLEELKDLGYVR